MKNLKSLTIQLKAVRNLNQAIGHVEDIQTRVNVLGKELKKADESFDENLE